MRLFTGDSLAKTRGRGSMVDLIGAGYREDGAGFIVMELARFGSLHDLIYQPGHPLAARDFDSKLKLAVKIVRLTLSFSYCQDDGFLWHSDLHTGNILVR
jgi:hypothetical protein